jgi:hypothetical protein
LKTQGGDTFWSENMITFKSTTLEGIGWFCS